MEHEKIPTCYNGDSSNIGELESNGHNQYTTKSIPASSNPPLILLRDDPLFWQQVYSDIYQLFTQNPAAMVRTEEIAQRLNLSMSEAIHYIFWSGVNVLKEEAGADYAPDMLKAWGGDD